jgi:4-hydroxy-tetrahydrodipicolinate reductase
LLKIAVLGAGRMAREILQVIHDEPQCEVSGIWARSAAGLPEALVSPDLPPVLAAADIAIDFTLADATSRVIRDALIAGKPLVCGVSGLGERQIQEIEDASARIPLLYDRNMSYGIAVLTRLLQQSGDAFGSDFITEIHETHHRNKVDAPSGTALLLGETLAASRGQSFTDVYHYDPDGDGAAPANSIGFFVSREGDIPGDHSVIFRNAAESVQLSHSIADRRVFAEGAVKAALWLAGRPAGRYRMLDVLGQQGKSAGASGSA